VGCAFQRQSSTRGRDHVFARLGGFTRAARLPAARVLSLRAEDRPCGVAKGYRQYLIDRGEFSTLAERATETPVLKRFFKGFEYHWVHSDLDRSEEAELVLANIQRLQQAGVPISFFYPKWPAKEYSSMEANSANWQAVFLDEPAPGAWSVQVKQLEQIRQLGCAIKIMINLHNYDPQAPGFDPVKSRGQSNVHWNLNQRHAPWVIDT